MLTFFLSHMKEMFLPRPRHIWKITLLVVEFGTTFY
jgi:hypothetical protein